MITWIKVSTGIFDDEKIRLIESMPDADSLIVIWFKLLAQAGKCNAGGNVTVIEGRRLTDEMLSTLFNRPVNTVRLALQTFREFGMIDDQDSTIKILNWCKHQNVEALDNIREKTRLRVAQYRGRQKIKLLEGSKPDCNVTVALRNALDKNKNKKREIPPPVFDLAGLLADSIRHNYPKHSKLSNGKYQECVQLWAVDIEKLHRLDNQSLEDIRSVIEWCQANDFWKDKILSGENLRKKWDQLYIQAMKNKGRTGSLKVEKPEPTSHPKNRFTQEELNAMSSKIDPYEDFPELRPQT